ncbi:N-alkane-inducible cytochrome P450 [Penicillium angulare]|uniref:N-alkane-inducible cytochrome P450 n=1 Tax=Penicillium angulare TaxID=116970 RepID=A0A9W9G735_9EURO|nr:N-alkane-inducible cytochrome P450 [Penicillium angulare]
MHFSYIIAGAVFVLLCARIRRYLEIRAFKKANNCEPPVRSPQSERILGWRAYKLMKKARDDHVALPESFNRAMKFGRTHTIIILGHEVITTCDPECIKTILATKFTDFGIGPRESAWGPLLGRGIFTTDGPSWQHSRALIRPGFTRSQVSDLETFETHVQALIKCLPTENGVTVDLQPLFFNLTIDSATDFLLGHSVHTQGSAPGTASQEFSEGFDYAASFLHKREEVGKLAFLVGGRKFKEACANVHKFTDGYIHEALRGGNKVGRYNLLAELAEQSNDPIQIRNELLNILLAARDTTAGLLSSVFYLLSRNPEKWNKLNQEIEAMAGGQIPDYKVLKEMPYLKAVLNETLRLFPPVPINARYALKDTTLPRGGGPDGLSPMFVPKGARMFYSVWALHRLPETWGNDADTFRPERWLDEKNPLRPGWGYLPFNGGPRLCLGQQSALVETSYLIVRMLQTFERIEPRDPLPWKEHLAVTMSCQSGCKIALWKRKD